MIIYFSCIYLDLIRARSFAFFLGRKVILVPPTTSPQKGSTTTFKVKKKIKILDFKIPTTTFKFKKIEILNFKIPKQPPSPPLPPHRTKSPLKWRIYWDKIFSDLKGTCKNLGQEEDGKLGVLILQPIHLFHSVPSTSPEIRMRSCVWNCFLLIAHLCGKVVAIASTAAPCKLLAWWSVWRAEPPGSNASCI